MSRKTRSDNLLVGKPFTDELRRKLVVDNLSYDQCIQWLKDEHGLKVADGTIGDFFRKHCFAFRFSEARTVCDSIDQVMAAKPERFEQATKKAMLQRLFEFLTSQQAPIKDVTMLASALAERDRLELEQKKVALESRRVTVQEKKLCEEVLSKAAEIQDIASDGSLDNDAKIAAVRARLFGAAGATPGREAA
jgi:hypothetical protein